MKTIFRFLAGAAFWLTLLPAHAQDLPFQQGLQPLPLTAEEQFVLSGVPLVTLPEAYKGDAAPLLPVSVDNSTQPYFRSITMQSGYECGQSAGICFNFTYELDRLRGVPANTNSNTYPSHFAWDFLNNANNYTGASFFDSWEIVRACGTMNVTDYGGGLNTGGYTRWISGYDAYYNGMKNRINVVKAIRVDNPEGLQTLKYWLWDHLEGAAVGGVANIYGQYFGAPVPTLPAGTPEAGKYVQTSWGGSPSHAWTICGFNDSIRYDFNGDGQYTNNIDINGDGIVDMHDWEKGAVKFANGYAGTGWCNSGFCYTMYKNLADKIGSGGIWNNTVYILDIKSTCAPQLTMKVTLKHTSRNKLKVTAGISTDLAATVPSNVLEFPIFNFQGGDHYMQGGTTEADKTIEFGLDLSPLISQISNNTPAKYFLQVQEDDPSGGATGEIVGWSLCDYTSATPVITTYPGVNTAIQNNTVTRLSQNYTLIFSKPSITNATLPPAQLYQPYTANLNATGGTPPYRWDAKLDYPETTTPGVFPAVTTQQLTLTNNNTGYAIKNIGFNFPFYKKYVNKLYIYADGYILFDDQPYTWPYIVDKSLLFRQTAIVCPFMGDLTIYPSSAQGVWFEGTSNYAIIRWKASFTGMQGSSNLNFAVKLYANGTIEYYYGDMLYPVGTAWTGGMSSGDNRNYQYSAYHNGAVTANTVDKFTTCGFPPEMQITEEGQFTGTPTYSYQNLPVKFLVTDNNNISSTKILLFNTVGLLVNQSVEAGGDTLIEYGETANITLDLSNIGTQPVNNILFTVMENDPYITLIDSSETVPVVAGGQSLTLTNAFSFHVSSDVPDNHPFTITLQVQSQEQTFQRPLNMLAHAPVFRITKTEFADGDNGNPDPGESADLLLTYKNTGSAKAAGMTFNLTSLDTNLVMNVAAASAPLILPDSSKQLTFHATAGPSASMEYLYKIKSNLTAANNFARTDTVYLFSGDIVEDFESGGFQKFPWYFGGNAPWELQSTVVYEGAYSAKAGFIVDNQESRLRIAVNVLSEGPISFWKYVSCEHDPSGSNGYDYLAFMIDNFEMGKWDGIIPWSKETFQVPAGYHILTWVYHKDYSVAAGWDGALIDYIKFPLIGDAVPEMTVTPGSITATLQPGSDTTTALIVANTGGGILNYAATVFDTTANKKDNFSDNLSSSYITCNTEGFVPGQAFSWTFWLYNKSSDNEYIRDVKFDLPPGVTVATATNFSGGSLGELTFLGAPGNGASLTWHGVSAGNRGVVKPGDSAVAVIAGTISEPFNGDVFVIFNLGGDNMGGAPHQYPGQVKVMNYGLANGWCTLENRTGSLMHGLSDSITVHIGTTGMAQGIYHCNIVVNDLHNNKAVIPVTLNIPFPVGTPHAGEVPQTRLLGAFPNPFVNSTLIQFELEHGGDARFEVYNVDGNRVAEWKTSVEKAQQSTSSWNGRDASGSPLPPGVYTLRMTAQDYSGTLKLVIVR